MSDQLLASVIELEKALQEEARLEEARAAAWQERELAGLTATLAAAREEQERWQAEQMAAARQNAEAAGEALRVAGAARCARLAALPDSFFEEVLRRHLHMLLPEAGNDHPHGQG